MKFVTVAAFLIAPAAGFVIVARPVTPVRVGLLHMLQERSTALPFDKRPENLDGKWWEAKWQQH
jgi:hypothetical protein